MVQASNTSKGQARGNKLGPPTSTSQAHHDRWTQARAVVRGKGLGTLPPKAAEFRVHRPIRHPVCPASTSQRPPRWFWRDARVVPALGPWGDYPFRKPIEMELHGGNPKPPVLQLGLGLD